MPYFLAIFILLASLTAGQSHIGDTLQQLVEKYGKPYSSNTDEALWILGDTSSMSVPPNLRVEFSQGKAIKLWLDLKRKISNEEINQVLAKYAHSGKWVSKYEGAFSDTWYKSQDGRFEASVLADGSLVIETKEAVGAKMAELERQTEEEIERGESKWKELSNEMLRRSLVMPCPACGHQVSTTAQRCPSCDHRINRP